VKRTIPNPRRESKPGTLIIQPIARGITSQQKKALD